MGSRCARERGRLVTLAQKPGEAKFGDKLAQLKSLVSASERKCDNKSTAPAEAEVEEDDFFIVYTYMHAYT